MLEPGATLTVGSHTVTVVKFLSEGGYSRIYEVNIQPEESELLSHSPQLPQVACLKEVKVADKTGLIELRKEVDVMRMLRKARNIVNYFDSNAERMPDGSYQVLVLMELCPNKSLLEYMNAHIREKLTEKQILAIVLDIAVAVYEMHRIQLIHRDIKIENVLIDASHHFKLCDFGSVSTAIPPPKNQKEFLVISHDILYNTTPQYRAPEMLDLTRGFAIDEKSDIWAFGCFLYKLCYFTTPFEAAGDLAILHASFLFPSIPLYSGDLKNLIIIMLQQDPRFRPNIVQLLMILAKMNGKEFSDMNIEDFTKSGPYNFAALHEMQKEMQKQLQLQQKQQQEQYYYEQLKQILQKDQQLQRSVSKDTLSSGEEKQAISRQGSVATSPVYHPYAPKASCESSSYSSLKSPSSTKGIGDTPAYSVPNNLHTRSGYNTPTRPSSIVNYDKVSLALGSGPAEKQSSPLVNAEVEVEVELADEIDFHLDNLDDIENRYPTLDELNEVVALPHLKAESLRTQNTSHSAQKKLPELENVEAWKKSGSKILDRDAERLASDIFGSGGAKDISTQNIKVSKTSRSTATVNEAIEDGKNPVSSRNGSNTSSEGSQLPNSKVPAIQLKPAVEFNTTPSVRGLDKGNTKESFKQKQYTDGDCGKSQDLAHTQELQQDSGLNNSPLARVILQNQNHQVYLQPVSRSVSLNQHQVQPQNTSLGQPGSQKVPIAVPQVITQMFSSSGVPNQQPGYSVAPSKSPFVPATMASVSSSNPWGSALDKTPKMESKMEARNSITQFNKIPTYNLTKQILNLSLDESNSIVLPSQKNLKNSMIELEVGLSSSSSSVTKTVTPNLNANSKEVSLQEELSLIDLDDDNRLIRVRTEDGQTKPSFRKDYSGYRDPNVAWQEEVIDFASDDENSKSDLSRVAIRQSLKKTRKSSDHRRTESVPRRSESRGESTSGESRKRLSFFSQGS